MRHDPARVAKPARSGRGIPGRLLLITATGLAVLISAGCGTAARAGSAVDSTVTIAYAPGVDTAPLYLAQMDHFFANEGLSHVVLKTFKNASAALSALQLGQADIAASDYGDIFYTQATKPGGLQVLADGYDANPGVLELVTMPGSNIASPASLQGSVVGAPDDQVLPTNTPGHPISLEVAAASQVLTSFVGNNVDSITWRTMPQRQEIQQLQNGQLQAALLTQPYIFEAQSQLGAVELFDAASGSTADLPLTGYVASDAWVEHNPAAVADFRAAINQAQSQASMSGQVQRVLPKITTMKAADADLATIGTYPTSTSVTALQRVVRLLWQTVWDAGAFRKINPPDVRKMIVSPS